MTLQLGLGLKLVPSLPSGKRNSFPSLCRNSEYTWPSYGIAARIVCLRNGQPPSYRLVDREINRYYIMLIYIEHHHKKTSNALDTLVLSEQECFQWTPERLVTTRRITEVSRQRIANSKSSVQQQQKTDDQVSWVGNVAQEVGVVHIIYLLHSFILSASVKLARMSLMCLPTFSRHSRVCCNRSDSDWDASGSPSCFSDRFTALIRSLHYTHSTATLNDYHSSSVTITRSLPESM